MINNSSNINLIWKIGNLIYNCLKELYNILRDYNFCGGLRILSGSIGKTLWEVWRLKIEELSIGMDYLISYLWDFSLDRDQPTGGPKNMILTFCLVSISMDMLTMLIYEQPRSTALLNWKNPMLTQISQLLTTWLEGWKNLSTQLWRFKWTKDKLTLKKKPQVKKKKKHGLKMKKELFSIYLLTMVFPSALIISQIGVN